MVDLSEIHNVKGMEEAIKALGGDAPAERGTSNSLVVPASAGAADIPPKGGTTSVAKRPIIRFHTASSPFTVERDLRVKIATKRKSPRPNSLPDGPGTKVRPGDDVEVTITTTDPQGKPVAAELSLAMVEQSLLERFASPLPGSATSSAAASATGRPLHFEHHLQLSPGDTADQPAAAGGKGPRGDCERRGRKPQSGSC